MSPRCSTGWRRRAVAALGVMLPALALVLATSQASQAGQAGQAATVGAGWHDFSPSLGTSSLEAMYAPTASDAWAVGQTSSQQSLYLHFDGTSWSSVDGPNIYTVYAVDGTSSSDLWVLGATSSAHYDGSSWTTYPLALAGEEGVGLLYTSGINQVFDAGPDNVYARVLAVRPDGTLDEFLEHFDGTAWSFVTGAPNVSPTGSAVLELTGSGPDDVYVYAEYDNNTQDELLHYDGTSWSVVSLPGSPVAVRVYDTGGGQALALGEIIGGGYYAAALGGGTWTETGLPNSDEPLNSAAGAGTVWTVMLDGSDNEHLWQWSGGQWTEVQPDNADGLLAGTTDGHAMWSFTEGGSLGGGIPAKVELYVK